MFIFLMESMNATHVDGMGVGPEPKLAANGPASKER